MTDDEAHIAVRATLALLTRVAEKTRSPVDDLLMQILARNEAKLATAVRELAKDPTPPTPERIAAALTAVGIKV